jgi:predicted DNA-binding transcriptional regulator AlpA
MLLSTLPTMKDDLVAIPEIAEILGVTRQRASKIIQSYDDFPTPAAELSIGRVWQRADVESWARSHPRRPGRRPSSLP